MASCFPLLFIIFFFVLGADARTITVLNNCPNTIWPVIEAEGPQQQQLSTKESFQLPSKTSRQFNISTPWMGQVWAQTECSSTNDGKLACLTGEASLASLAQFNITSNGQDFYIINLADGSFNLPISITPQGGNVDSCKPSKCNADVNALCPTELQMKKFNGEVIVCRNACLVFNEPQYCCTEEFDSPNKCNPSNYSGVFKALCPQACSYRYEYVDGSCIFKCNGQPNYVITFCEKVDDHFSVCSAPIRLQISKVQKLV